LAVRMVADVTETRNVIPSLEFKTCMTIKSYDLSSIYNFFSISTPFLLNPNTVLKQFVYNSRYFGYIVTNALD